MHFYRDTDRLRSPAQLLCQLSPFCSSLQQRRSALQNKETQSLNIHKITSLALISMKNERTFSEGLRCVCVCVCVIFPLLLPSKKKKKKRKTTRGRELLWKISGWMVKAWPTCKVIGNTRVERKVFGNMSIVLWDERCYVTGGLFFIASSPLWYVNCVLPDPLTVH